MDITCISVRVVVIETDRNKGEGRRCVGKRTEFEDLLSTQGEKDGQDKRTQQKK